MANKNDYFYKQTVTEAELDSGFDKIEAAAFKIMSDQLLQGIFQGAEITQSLTPALSVDANGPALIYDQLGRRVFWSPVQDVDCSVDENSNSTAVITPGNSKVLSIFAEFDRLLSDPRVDGNAATVYFNRDEYFKINVVQGVEATTGIEVAPALRSDQILLADITIDYAQTQILNADIDVLDRRQDTFVLSGSPNNVREGTVLDTLQEFQDQINTFIGGALPASSITFAGSTAWADGTTNPAGSVEGQLDKIVTDLTAGAGAAKIITAAGPNWKDATTNPAERLDQRLDSIITDLSANAGAAKLGVTVGAGGIITGGVSVQAALEELEAETLSNLIHGSKFMHLDAALAREAGANDDANGPTFFNVANAIFGHGYRPDSVGSTAVQLGFPLHAGDRIIQLKFYLRESSTANDVEVEMYGINAIADSDFSVDGSKKSADTNAAATIIFDNATDGAPWPYTLLDDHIYGALVQFANTASLASFIGLRIEYDHPA